MGLNSSATTLPTCRKFSQATADPHGVLCATVCQEGHTDWGDSRIDCMDPLYALKQLFGPKVSPLVAEVIIACGAALALFCTVLLAVAIVKGTRALVVDLRERKAQAAMEASMARPGGGLSTLFGDDGNSAQKGGRRVSLLGANREGEGESSSGFASSDMLRAARSLTDQDLRRVVCRIYFGGANNPSAPWRCPTAPPRRIASDIDATKWNEFAKGCNARARWGDCLSWERWLHNIACVAYWPLAAIFLEQRRRARFARLQSFILDSDVVGSLLQLKFNCSPDVSLAYIDVLRFGGNAASRPRATSSSAGAAARAGSASSEDEMSTDGQPKLPLLLLFAGDGSYLRPLHLDPNDVLVRSPPTLPRLRCYMGEYGIGWIDFVHRLNTLLWSVDPSNLEATVKSLTAYVAEVNTGSAAEPLHMLGGLTAHLVEATLRDDSGLDLRSIDRVVLRGRGGGGAGCIRNSARDAGCCSSGVAERAAGAGSVLRGAVSSIARFCGFRQSRENDAAIGRRLGVLLVKRSLARAAPHLAAPGSGSAAAGDRSIGESGNTSLNSLFASESGESAQASRLHSQHGSLASFEPLFADEGFGDLSSTGRSFSTPRGGRGGASGGGPVLDRMRLNSQRLLELESDQLDFVRTQRNDGEFERTSPADDGPGLRSDALNFGATARPYSAAAGRAISPTFEDGLAGMGAVDVSGSLRLGAHAFFGAPARLNLQDTVLGPGGGEFVRSSSIEMSSNSISSVHAGASPSPPQGAVSGGEFKSPAARGGGGGGTAAPGSPGDRRSLRERAGLAPSSSPRSGAGRRASLRRADAARTPTGLHGADEKMVLRSLDDASEGRGAELTTRKWWLHGARATRVHGAYWLGCLRALSCACPHILFRNTTLGGCGGSRGYRALMKASDLSVLTARVALLALILLDAACTGVFFANSCLFMWCVAPCAAPPLLGPCAALAACARGAFCTESLSRSAPAPVTLVRVLSDRARTCACSPPPPLCAPCDSTRAQAL